MGANTITILQAGDIHYPEAKDEKLSIDIKDSAFPSALASRLAQTPFQCVIRKIQEIIGDDGCDVLAFMGDLTTQGDKADYNNCVNYISDALLNRSHKPFPSDRVIVVPGNHDIHRKDADDDIGKKFNHMNASLAKYGIADIKVDEVNTIKITKDKTEQYIVGMNTCIGCGSLRSLPPLIRKNVEEIYDKELGAAASSDAKNTIFNELYEQLDTPIIDENAIRQLSRLSDQTSGVLVACAHHNILPQSTPRIAPYTEMVNSGSLRQSLLKLGKSVIYLHGHTHTDPIEIVSTPEQNQSQVIVISAPKLSDGFNLVDVVYTHEGHPLGCTVKCFRYRDGTVSIVKNFDVPFSQNSLLAPSREHSRVLNAINEKMTMYWSELKDTTDFKDEQLREILLELKWRGQLQIVNDQENKNRWIVRRNY